MIAAFVMSAGILGALCEALGAPTEPVDPVDSAAYQRVGDEARDRGDPRIAAIAYRRAAQLDPSNAAAKASLAALCRADRAEAPDDLARLLAGIDRYQAHDLDGAKRLLATVGGEGATGAHVFLGLIALDHHEARTAEAELAAAGADPAYRDIIRGLQRLAARDGRIVAVVTAQPGVDSNPELLPDTPPQGATTGSPKPDADLLASGALALRPVRWLVVRDTVLSRTQRREVDLDLFANTAQVALELDHGSDHVTAGYDLDDQLIGGDPYLVAHGGQAGYRRDLGRVTLGIRGTVRHRAYQRVDQAPFTGYVSTAELALKLRIDDTFDLELGAKGGRESTRDPVFSAFGAGGQATLHARLGRRCRLAGSAIGWYARYDGRDAEGGRRQDGRGDLEVDGEVDVSDHVIGVASAGVTRNLSTVEDVRYTKLFARLGIAIAFGWL